MPMTYQNLWGLHPNPPVRRAIIGKSVLFPLLMHYPEDTNLSSLAAREYFKLAYLNKPSSISEHLMKSETNNAINVQSLMYPETKRE